MRCSRRLVLGLGLGGLVWLGSCSDDNRPCNDPTGLNCQPPDGVILSDPASAEVAAAVQRAPRSVAFSLAAQVTGGDDDVAYISLPSGSFPEGALARIQSSSFTGSVLAPMIEGGLDPVPISATAGDSVEIEILSADLVTLNRTGGRVPATRRPKVVRTVPPRGKTDIAVNTVIVVIFSEPVDASSLSSSAIRLLQGGSPVPGVARLIEGVTAAVSFQPSEQLNPNTSYQLVVTQNVRDLDGEALESEVSVDFTVGTEFAPGVSQLTVIPDISALAVGSQVQLVVSATAGDDTIRIPVPVAGVPILWSTENPSVATVSSTGLVTARGEGEALVRAQALSNPNVSAASFVLVSASQVPVALLEVVPSADTTPVTGKIELTAVTRDAGGNVVQFRPVSWTTSSPFVATVEQVGAGRAWITGVAPGTASIIATSEGRADTVTIDVVNPGPYATLSAGSGPITCGLRTAGWAFCWGANASGKLGNGTSEPTRSMPPTSILGAHRFSQLSTGPHNTCAVTAQQEAYCWGSNTVGGLGIGTVNGPELCQFAGGCSRRPVAVSAGLDFAEIHLGQGWGFVCGLTSTGAVYCWGANRNGTLGTGSTTGPEACPGGGQFPQPCSTVPVAVAGGRSYTALTSGGTHACALTAEGQVYCWGDNMDGQLGDGTTTDRASPVPIVGAIAFTTVSAGWTHTCALTAEGTAYCWGSNRTGALGTGDLIGPDSCPDRFGGSPVACSRAPVPVSQSLTWSAVSAGFAHTCALDLGGAAYCWGQNESGQLGTGNTQNSPLPVAVVGGLTFANLTAGDRHTCGVTRTTSVAYCWGSNDNFALGSSLGASPVPVRVEGQP